MPISNAKQTKEVEASKIQAASNLFRYHDPMPETIFTDQPLFINKRFALNEMFQWNASKFAIIYV